jgi:ribosomal protein S18 acetylase RimI-like enzyme
MTTVETTVTVCDYSIPEHRQAVIRLMNAYIKDEMGGGKPLSPREQNSLINGLNKHPKSIVLLASTNGVFAGLLVAYENFSTFTAKPMINIHDIIVLKEYRGLGAGRELITALIEAARDAGCSRITLEVRKDNIVAQNLYKSLDFNDTDPEMFYWRKNL